MEPRDEWGLDLTEDDLYLRRAYEGDLFQFAQYVNPLYVYGEIHEEVFTWLSRTESTDPEIREEAENQLLLLPRGHLKSHCMAVYAVWKITREPWTTIIYLTAGEDLATVQMAAIKGMFECEEYRTLWPEMFEEREGDRAKWSAWAINVDHPIRKEYRIRDYTVIIKTIGGSSQGLHCDVLLGDDVVVISNAYTDSGREQVARTVSDFAAIANPGSISKFVGTRHDEKDEYGKMMEAKVPIIDPTSGEQVGEYPQWQVMQRQVEDQGDGLGNYLWPRTQSSETELWFGFDLKELIKRKVKMLSSGGTLMHFNTQYYNDPNKKEGGEESGFQYYKRAALSKVGDTWYYGEKKLEVTAGMDLAWTDPTGKNGKRADYTAIAVIGIDEDGFIYVLDVKRFKTDKYDIYYKHLAQLYDFWRFRKIYIESEGAGKFIIEELQKRIRENALNLVAIGRTVSRTMSKEERCAAVLETRYSGNTILHYKGGVIGELEQQLTQLRPKFDDCRDALALAVQNARAPMKHNRRKKPSNAPKSSNTRFGGRRR